MAQRHKYNFLWVYKHPPQIQLSIVTRNLKRQHLRYSRYPARFLVVALFQILCSLTVLDTTLLINYNRPALKVSSICLHLLRNKYIKTTMLFIFKELCRRLYNYYRPPLIEGGGACPIYVTRPDVGI